MCGVAAVLLGNSSASAAQVLYNALTMLQHRGQDAAGIVTSSDGFLHLHKANGLVSEVFKQSHMDDLQGSIGVGHCRYPTAGCSTSAEAQPFYTNTPCGVCLAHNGNLTNTDELRRIMNNHGRHINTTSDSEVLLNIFAASLPTDKPSSAMTPDDIFQAARQVHSVCVGAFGCVLLVNNVGIVAVRDRFGIRPLCYGTRGGTDGGGAVDHLFASESVAMESLNFRLERDVAPGETVFVDMRSGKVHSMQTASHAVLAPCIFEHVYFARPDSFLDGVSVYQARLNMGSALARKIKRMQLDGDIDVVIPIPDTSRTSALQLSYDLNLPYREGFIKNRYIARTFIMPGQKMRKKNVRRKLNPIRAEFQGKNVLLVDDSIVRGTTATQIVQLARDAGAQKVFFASAAPAVRHPNVYGIDMPVHSEFVAHQRSADQVADVLGADWLVYQDLGDLEAAVRKLNPNIQTFDTSCFSGTYITGDVTPQYLEQLSNLRNDSSKSRRNAKYSTDVVGPEEKREEAQQPRRSNPPTRSSGSAFKGTNVELGAGLADLDLRRSGGGVSGLHAGGRA